MTRSSAQSDAVAAELGAGRHDPALLGAARLLARTVGLRFEPAIRGRLSRCLIEAAQARGLDTVSYVALLERDADAVQDLLNRVTVQETSFFRDPLQFIALAEQILPAQAGPLTVWSSACANGQEAYSLAMTLAESGIDDWKVVASDVSTRALARTRSARYATRELRGVSDARRAQHFRKVGDQWEIVPALRERVQVVHHNLVADPPPFPPHTCPIVFCRNVLIYFRDEEIVAFLGRLGTWLPPGGWLFLGYSESLWQVQHNFRLTRVGESYLYQQPLRAQRTVEEPSPPQRPTRRRSTGPDAPPTPAPRRPGPRGVAAVASGPTDCTAAPQGPVQRPLPSAGTSVADLMAAGGVALNSGDYTTAVAHFRKSAYLDPEHAIAHLNLGLALEASGHVAAARRAYGAARAALGRVDAHTTDITLDGYQREDFVRLVDAKLASRPA
jgi:chemotaxis protein methyltransferase CheR